MLAIRRQRRAGGPRRETALDAVVEVLVERGFEGTRLLDVSQQSGIAISTLQNYFGSREDMLIEALLRLTAKEVSALEAVAASQPDPWRRLNALIDRSLSTPRTIHVALVEFWRSAIRDLELREASSDVQLRYRVPYLHALQDGVDQGVFTLDRAPEDVADYILTILSGLIMPRAIGQSSPSAPAVHRLLLDHLRALLGLPPEEPVRS